jgi:mgtE-like transporter
VAAYVAGFLVFGVASVKIVWVAVIAGTIATAVLTPLTVVTAVKLFDRGVNPDNVMGPYVTSTGDLVSIAGLLIGVVIVA